MHLRAPLRENAGSKLHAAKTTWPPPGLGAFNFDLVATEVEFGDSTVGLQGICECLSRTRRVEIASCEDPVGTAWL